MQVTPEESSLIAPNLWRRIREAQLRMSVVIPSIKASLACSSRVCVSVKSAYIKKKRLLLVLLSVLSLLSCQQTSAFAFSVRAGCHSNQIRLAMVVSSSATITASTSAPVTLQHSEFSRMSATTTTTTTTTASSSSPGASPVILLHGLLGSKRNFASIGTSLSNQLSRKRRIFGVDLRNHGETCRHVDNWRDEMEYSDMAQDVLTFMNEQKLDKAVLVGHSMGGKVAQACALLEPERVDGLVVLDIAPVTYTTEDAHWKAVQDIIECMTKVNVGPGVTKQMVDQQLRQAIPDPALRAFVLTNLDVSGGGCQWKIHLHAIAKQLDRLAAFDIPSHHRYDGDVFFIHGGQSKFVRSSYMQSISDYFPNHLLTTIRGAGHWVHAEAPDDTTALLKRYLDR